MALSKLQKNQLISQATDLFSSSKIIVLVNYKGTSVKELHQLRLKAKENNTYIKVFKNRLIIQAISNIEQFKKTDTSMLKDMIIYAFNPDDELAPTQFLANMSKSISSINFAGAFLADGSFINKESVIELSKLPSMIQLKSMLVGTLAAPLSGFTRVLQGNLTGLLNVLQARSNSIN